MMFKHFELFWYFSNFSNWVTEIGKRWLVITSLYPSFQCFFYVCIIWFYGLCCVWNNICKVLFYMFYRTIIHFIIKEWFWAIFDFLDFFYTSFTSNFNSLNSPKPKIIQNLLKIFKLGLFHVMSFLCDF